MKHITLLLPLLILSCSNSSESIFPEIGKTYKLQLTEEHRISGYPMYRKDIVKILDTKDNGWAKIEYYIEVTPKEILEKYTFPDNPAENNNSSTDKRLVRGRVNVSYITKVPDKEKVYRRVTKWLNLAYVYVAREREEQETPSNIKK